MARYFRIIEIDVDTFERITDDSLDCAQVTIPVDGDVYVAIDDEDESELSIDLEFFDQKE